MTTLAVTSVSSLLCQVSTCFRIGSKFRCMRSTPTEMQSISENDFECLASTGVNTLGTISPNGRGAALSKTGSESTKQHCGCWCGGESLRSSGVSDLEPFRSKVLGGETADRRLSPAEDFVCGLYLS